MTPAWLRPLAEADLVECSRYYLAHAGEAVATRFFGAAVEALQAVERMPGTGSPRVGELCDIPGLRVRRLTGFPCGWFYFVRSDHLDVVRLLADAQDFGAILNDLNDESPEGGRRSRATASRVRAGVVEPPVPQSDRRAR